MTVVRLFEDEWVSVAVWESEREISVGEDVDVPDELLERWRRVVDEVDAIQGLFWDLLRAARDARG
jgi:hypothetical protein